MVALERVAASPAVQRGLREHQPCPSGPASTAPSRAAAGFGFCATWDLSMRHLTIPVAVAVLFALAGCGKSDSGGGSAGSASSSTASTPAPAPAASPAPAPAPST